MWLVYLGEERKEYVGNNPIVGVPKLYFPAVFIKSEGVSAENKHTALDILHFPDSK